jgi:hypothetical protein
VKKLASLLVGSMADSMVGLMVFEKAVWMVD